MAFVAETIFWSAGLVVLWALPVLGLLIWRQRGLRASSKSKDVRPLRRFKATISMVTVALSVLGGSYLVFGYWQDLLAGGTEVTAAVSQPSFLTGWHQLTCQYSVIVDQDPTPYYAYCGLVNSSPLKLLLEQPTKPITYRLRVFPHSHYIMAAVK